MGNNWLPSKPQTPVYQVTLPQETFRQPLRSSYFRLLVFWSSSNDSRLFHRRYEKSREIYKSKKISRLSIHRFKIKQKNSKLS